MRLKIQVTMPRVSGSSGGLEMPMTVMLSRMSDAVLGMARTTRHATGLSPLAAASVDSICPSVTPARMLISSLPSSAAAMPGSERISCTM